MATKTVAEDLVKSIKEAYEEHGSAPPERYMREIESQTCANPTLAQYVFAFYAPASWDGQSAHPLGLSGDSRAMQHAIPVLASAGQKRRRTEQVATSSLR